MVSPLAVTAADHCSARASRASVWCRVINGVVTLSGDVPHFATRAEAEDIVEGIAGVEDVINALVVTHPSSALERSEYSASSRSSLSSLATARCGAHWSDPVVSDWHTRCIVIEHYEQQTGRETDSRVMINKQNEKEEEQVLEQLLAKFDQAMVITRDDEGRIHARPMRIVERNGLRDMWFVCGPGRMTAEVGPGALMSLTLQDTHRYVFLSGSGTVIRDRFKAKEIWSEELAVWGLSGPDDPALRLVHFHPEHAEYWNQSGKAGLLHAVQVLKAVVSPDPNITRSKIQEGQAEL